MDIWKVHFILLFSFLTWCIFHDDLVIVLAIIINLAIFHSLIRANILLASASTMENDFDHFVWWHQQVTITKTWLSIRKMTPSGVGFILAVFGLRKASLCLDSLVSSQVSFCSPFLWNQSMLVCCQVLCSDMWPTHSLICYWGVVGTV